MVKISLIFILSKNCYQFEGTRQTVQEISYFYNNLTLQLGMMVNVLSLKRKSKRFFMLPELQTNTSNNNINQLLSIFVIGQIVNASLQFVFICMKMKE